MSFELEFCEPEQPIERKPICEPVRLLFDSPFADRRWLIVKRLPDPGFYLLATADELTMVIFETQFERIQ